MKIRLFILCLTLALLSQVGLLQAMQTAKQPLSLKYQCAKKVSADLANTHSEKKRARKLASLPEEVKEYVGTFEQLECAIRELVESICVVDTGDWHTKSKLIYNNLLKIFMTPLDTHYGKKDNLIGSIVELNSNLYTLQEKRFTVNSLFRNAKPLAKQRAVLTDLLHKAITNNHVHLVLLFARQGAYFNSKRAETPLFHALRIGNIHSILALIDARQFRNTRKELNNKIKKMEKFINQEAIISLENMPEPDQEDVYPAARRAAVVTPLTVALATGNIELLKIFISVTTQNKLNLYNFLHAQGTTVFGDAFSRAISQSDFIAPMYQALNGGISEHDPKRVTKALEFLFAVAHHNKFCMEDFFTTKPDEHSVLSVCACTEFFEFLLQQAPKYDIDLDKFVNGVDKRLLQDLILRGKLSEVKLLVTFAQEHNIALTRIKKMLKQAAFSCNFEIIEFLIAAGFDVNLDQLLNARNSRNQTLSVRLFNDLNWRSDEGATESFARLMGFAESHNIALEGLLESLEIAKSGANIKLLELCIKKGLASEFNLESYLHERDQDNNTPLLRLVRNNNYYKLEALINFAKQRDIALPELEEALIRARNSNNVEALSILLPECTTIDKATFLNATDANDETVLIRLGRNQNNLMQLGQSAFATMRLLDLAIQHNVKLTRIPEALVLWANFPQIVELLNKANQD